MTPRRGDLDIPISCNTSTEDFCGGISGHTPLSSNAALRSHFSSSTTILFEDCTAGDKAFIWKQMKRLQTDF